MQASDEGVQRVLFVDVVNLLAMEGSYADQVRAILDDSEVWAAYRGQRHDLFLPAGGSGTNGVVALLKGSEVTRFALPAPEPPAPIAETSHQVRAEVPPVVEAGMPLSEVVQPPAEVKKEVPVEVPAAAAAPANEPVEVEKATEPLVNEGMTATFTPAAERMIDNPLDMPPVAAASPPVSRAKQPDAPMLPPAAIAPPPAPTNPLPAQAVGKTATSVAESRVVSFEQKTPPASPKPSPPPPQRQQVQRAPATVESPRPTPPRQETLSPTKATSDPLSALLGPSDPDESG